MAKKQTPESKVLHEVCEYLEQIGVTFWRQNNIPVYDVKLQLHRAMPKWCIKGVSDLVVLRNGLIHFIEVKAPKGVLSPDQKKFRDMVQKEGALYFVVKSRKDIEVLF